MAFPFVRLSRWRQSSEIRKLVQETTLDPGDLVQPLFVCTGKNVRKPIRSMPGQFQLSVDQLLKEIRELKKLGIPAVILFGIPAMKDESGSEAYDPDGIIQVAIREIKNKLPEMVVIADLCFCEYTSHGHCGIVRLKAKSKEQRANGKNTTSVRSTSNASRWTLDNDATLGIIAKTAVVQAHAGADIIAPSGMIDGMVKTIRTALDKNGFQNKIIMSYAAKYASSFYAPFREAAEGSPQFGDRRTYQMDPSNSGEALREIALDIEEGADIVMVKPALSYLDIVNRVKSKFHVPVAAYNVSGEYSMVKAAAEKGWIDERKIALEILTSIKRAGADLILTYHAKDVAKVL